MGNMDVTARLLADNAQFDAAYAKSQEVAGATSRAVENAARRAKDAQTTASKYIGDAVSAQSVKIVTALRNQREAQEAYQQAQRAARSGYLAESEGIRTVAAAMQRLTAAKREAVAASASSERGGKGLQDVLERVVLSSVGYIAAATGIRDIASAARDAVTSSLDFAETIHRASINTGLAAGTLSTLHYAAAVTGGDFEALTKGVGRMDKQIAAATSGNKTAAAVLQSLGLNARELANSPNGAEVAFRRMAETLANTKNAIQRVDLASQMMGQRMGVAQVATLIDVGTHMDEYREKAQAAGMYLDGPMSDQLASVNEHIKGVQQRVDGAKLAFTEGLIPGLTKFFSILQGGSPQISAFTTFAQGLTKQLNFAAAAVFSFAASMDTIKANTWDLGISKDRKADLASSARERAMAEQFDAAAHNGTPVAPATASSGPGTVGNGKGYAGTPDPEAASKAAAAAKKAAEQLLKGFEAQITQMKTQTSVSAKWEFDYWAQRISAFKRGSDEYNAIVAKEASLAVAGARSAHEEIVKFRRESAATNALDPKEADAGIEKFAKFQQQQAEDITKSGERWKAYNVELQRTGEILAKNAEAAKAFQIELAVKSGAMSRPDAARAMGGIHAADSAAKIAALQADVAMLTASLQNLDPNSAEYQRRAPVLSAQIATTNNAITEESGRASLQAMQDQWAAFSQTAGGAAVTALQQFTAQATDSAAQIKGLIDNTIHSLNSTILKTITNPGYMNRGNFSNLGKSIFTDISGTALQRGEAGMLSAMGISGAGKLGSKTNPMYTKSADAMHAITGAGSGVAALGRSIFGSHGPSGASASSASTLASGAAALGMSLFGANGPSMPDISPGSTSSSTAPPSGVGNLVSNLVGDATKLAIPFLDVGTNMVPHDMIAKIHAGEAVVPKRYNPAAGGAGGGGGVTNHHYNIDARGSSNPAQTMAMVHQAILQAAPHIVAASKASIRSDNSRVAPSARQF